MSLNRRSGFSPNHQPRFDVLDVAPADLATLIDVVETATTRADFESHADPIGRLRFDERSLSIEAFEAMVLRGACPPLPQ